MQKICAYKYCYFNTEKNCCNEEVESKIPCPDCLEVFYHTNACQKWDKFHQEVCTGKNSNLEKNLNLEIHEPVFTQSNASMNSKLTYPKNLSKLNAFNPKSLRQNLPKNPNKFFVINNYKIFENKLLGSGSYGKVVQAKECLTGDSVAVKIVSKKFLREKEQTDLLKREIYIQRNLKHQNILSLNDVFEDTDNIYLILEYVEGGSLFDYIQKRDGLNERDSFIFFVQTCLAIEFLHQNNIVHRDIKPENLLLDHKKNLKLCDFGCSFLFRKKSLRVRKTFCGTQDYMAPEFFVDKRHGLGVDIWAVGVQLYEMLHGTAPFDDKDEKEKVQMIVKLSPSKQKDGQSPQNFKDDLSEDAKDLIISLMRVDPVRRFKFDDIFKHNWVVKNAMRFDINLNRLRCKDKLLDDFIDDNSANNVMKNCNFRETEIGRYEKFDDAYTNDSKSVSNLNYESIKMDFKMDQLNESAETISNYRTEDLLKSENKENIFLDSNLDYKSTNFEYNLKSLTKGSTKQTSNDIMDAKKVFADITNCPKTENSKKQEGQTSSKRSSQEFVQYNYSNPQQTNEKHGKEPLVDSFLTKSSQKNKQCDLILEKIDQEIEKMNSLKCSISQYNNSSNIKSDQNYTQSLNKTQQETRSTPTNLSPFLSKEKDFERSTFNKKYILENEVGRQMLRTKRSEVIDKDHKERDSSITSRSLSKIKNMFAGMIGFLQCND